MTYNWDLEKPEDEDESGVVFPRDEHQNQYLAPPMDRSLGSGSSMESRRSMGSYQDPDYAASPSSIYSSPLSNSGLTLRGSKYEPQNTYLSRESSAELPLFNIERDGDPDIMWYMYYDFKVTKTEAYFQLQKGYLPTNNYPTIVKSEKVTMENGKKGHPCGMPECKAKPFTRHYDLERHFATLHQGDKERGDKSPVYCDYPKCPHKEGFRKDHCREHYREYHAEDLIKRSQPKHTKPKRGHKKPETIEEFIAPRLRNLDLSWWRCSKCVQRVKVNDHGYTCPGCHGACEPQRVESRQRFLKSGNNESSKTERDADSTTEYISGPSSYTTGCGQCQDTWLPDKKDRNLWVSCPRCRPGIKETTRTEY